MAISVDTYTGHTWVDNSTPDLEAEVLNEIEEGIRKNNTAIKAVLNALVSQITNDPDKFASMAALYAVNQNLGALNTTVTNINSNLNNKADKDVVIIRDQSFTDTTVPANGSVDISYTPLAVTGYTPLAYIPKAAGNSNAGITALTAALVRLRNFTSSSQVANPTISILYIKN